MAKRKTPTVAPVEKTILIVPRLEAAEKIAIQIEKGQAIRNIPTSSGDLDRANREKSKWIDYTSELLSRLFNNDSISDEFSRETYIGMFGTSSFQERVQIFGERMTEYINRLDSIKERLELIPESVSQVNQIATASMATPRDKVDYQKVFIVHGHDNEAKLDAARFVERLGLKAIIFHEQEDLGQTIIEKLERVSDVGYAIVLLTPDDIGYPKKNPDAIKYRARQNVIFEWGYFISKLSRKNVIALVKSEERNEAGVPSKELEVLSDMQGVLWTRMDVDGAWKLKLAKEMKAVGFDIDMNQL